MIAHLNYVDIFYTMSGNGADMILLHGNGESHHIFDKAIRVLSQRYKVYAIDSRDHGRSSQVDELHYQDMVLDVKEFIIQMNINKPIIYGFSDGGIIGLMLAYQFPDLLEYLIISGANLNPEGIRKSWLNLFKFIGKITNDKKIKLFLNEPNITPEDLQYICVPTAVLAGSRDMVRRKHTYEIGSHIKNSKVIILLGHGHGSYILHRKKIAKLILRILESWGRIGEK